MTPSNNPTETFTLSNVTLPRNVSRHFCGIYDNIMTVVAGQNDFFNFDGTAQSQSMLVFPGLNINNQWSPNSVLLPLDMDYMFNDGDISIIINGQMYIMSPGQPSPPHYIFIYNLISNQFTLSVIPITGGLRGTLCAVFNSNNGIIYTMYWGVTNRFNISNNTWMTRAANTVKTQQMAGCAFDPSTNNIFLFGGTNGNWGLTSIERYNQSNIWVIIPETLSLGRYGLTCRLVATDGNIYCMGGHYGGCCQTNVVDVFNPSTEMMINVLYLNIKRAFFAATLWNNNRCIIISGGSGEGVLGVNSIETFGDCYVTTIAPTISSVSPTKTPSTSPSNNPTLSPTIPSLPPTQIPSNFPTFIPTHNPTIQPSKYPTYTPTNSSTDPTNDPTYNP
eukprot:63394_1